MESTGTPVTTNAGLEPSDRERRAMELANRYMAWSAAGGLLPVPGLDMAAILAIQLKMLSEMSRIYGVPFRRDIVKHAVSSLLGSFLPVTIGQGTASAFKVVPGIGWIAAMFWQPALAAAATWAIAKVFVQHFESGGTFLDFKPEAVKEYFREQFEAARAGMTGRRSSTLVTNTSDVSTDHSSTGSI